jgi:hypothetical protein
LLILRLISSAVGPNDFGKELLGSLAAVALLLWQITVPTPFGVNLFNCYRQYTNEKKKCQRLFDNNAESVIAASNNQKDRRKGTSEART